MYFWWMRTWLGGGAALSSLPAPVIEWDDASQKLIIDFAEQSVVEGSAITIELYSDQALTTLIDEFTDTLDAAEIAAGLIEFMDSLSSGYARAKSTGSGWSNTEEITVDAGDTAGEAIG